MSSTVQFFRISPNLLPEKRPRNHAVGDVEPEGVVDPRQVIDTDQEERAGGTEALGFLDRFGERGDQMAAVQFAGQGIVSRQLQELLVMSMAFVVDPDDPLGADRPAIRTGEPAAGLLDPKHRRRYAGAHPIFDPVMRGSAMHRRRMRQCVEPYRALRLDQFRKFRPARQ